MDSEQTVEQSLVLLRNRLEAINLSLIPDPRGVNQTTGIPEARAILDEVNELLRGEIESKQRRIQDILESVEDGLFGLDRQWRFLFLNQRAARNVGYEPQDLVGKVIWEVFPVMTGTVQETLYRQAMEQRKFCHAEVRGVLTQRDYDIRVYPSDEGINIIWLDITAKNQLEQDLIEADLRYQTLFEESGTLNLILDRDGVCLLANKKAAQTMGVEINDLIQRNIIEFLPPDVAGPYLERIRETIDTGEAQEYEQTFHLPGGDRTFIINDRCIHNVSGQGIAILSSSVDITERKRIENQLRLHADILSAIQEAVIVVDLSYQIISWNQGAERTYGWKEAEVLGKRSKDVLRSELSIEQRAVYEKSLAEGVPIVTRLHQYTRDERRLLVEGYTMPLRDGEGKTIAYVAINRDITAQNLVQFQLQESERKYRELIQYAPAGIYEIDFRRQKFLSVNDSMCKILGYTEAEMLAMSPFDILDEEGRRHFQQRIRKWLSGEKPAESIEYKVRKKDGSTLIAILNVSFVRDENGEPLGAYVIGYDITGRKQAEEVLRRANQLLQEQAEELERRVQERTRELQVALATEKSLRLQLIHSEKFAALARLVGSVAHEINNPLQSVKNCLYLVQCENLPQSLDEVVDMAVSETQRMSNLVKQLRETYRPSAMHPMDFDLVELLARVCNLLSPQFRQKEIQWELHYPADSIMLHGIPDQIQQVCLNICLNAIDAIGPQGGMFEITVDLSEQERRVSVSFRDNGPGIANEDMSRLFEPFFTTKEKGTGLGLAICYEIIKNHGGNLEAESQPGQGATFTFHLPTA